MTPEEFKKSCKGIIPVQYCPMNEKMEVNYEGLKENTKFLVDFAEDGNKDLVIMTNGSTTEFYALPIEDQKKVIKTVVETADGKVPVIAGVSHPSALEAVKLAKYAEEVGADCVMSTPPYYHRAYRNELYEHYKTIAEAVDVAVMIYNNADVTGTFIPADLVAELAKIDNIVAIKDNTPTAIDYLLKVLLVNEKDMVLINGLGDYHYPASAAYGLRYQGFVTFIGNFAPQLSYAVYDAVMKGDFLEAMKAVEKISPLLFLMGRLFKKRVDHSILPEAFRTNYMYIPIGKAAMDIVGLHGGPLRPPLKELSPDEKEELRKILKEIGVI
jgi:4-hydroxy-tetrahydrodipicolinate synthase